MTWWVGAIAVAAAGVGAVWWLRRRYLIVTVLGRSMLPSYADRDRVLVRRVPAGRVRVGDVVVADLPPRLVRAEAGLGTGLAEAAGPAGPTGPGGRRAPVPSPPRASERVVKRVAAGSGDPVPSVVTTADARVPAGSLVLLGDNPAESADSRQYGYVAAERVVGVVLRHLR